MAAIWRPIACQCVSLAFRPGGHSHQLAGFSIGRAKMSVAEVTVLGDGSQARVTGGPVLRLTICAELQVVTDEKKGL